MVAKKKAAKSKSSKSGSAPKLVKTPPRPKAPSGNDNAAAVAQRQPQRQPELTGDQKVLALANTICGILNGQNAGVAMNALGAAAARICLTTSTDSANFSRLVTAQIEVQARLMLDEQRAAAAALAATPPKGNGKRKAK